MLLLRFLSLFVYLCLGIGIWTPTADARADAVLVRFRPPASGAVAGYKLYYALETSGSINSAPVDLGSRAPDSTGVSSYSLAGLDPSRSYSLELTAYDSRGVESRRSNRLTVAARTEALGAVLYQNNFDQYAPGVHVPGFIDTRGPTTSGNAGVVFNVAYRTDGSRSFYSSFGDGAVASRYIGSGSTSWGSYELSGSVRTETIRAQAAIGARWVNGSYFELAQTADARWQLRGIGEPGLSCAVGPSLGLTMPQARIYRFKYRVTRANNLTRLRAKLWLQGTAEPGWLADCWTTLASSVDSGAFLLERNGSGGVYFDDVVVTSVGGQLDPIPAR